jgi:hypothetical protein
MHTYVNSLQNISGRYAPSRLLSFDMVHVFKTLQLIKNKGHVSRVLLSKELELGDGAIKTLIKHLKMHSMIQTTNVGTKMTQKGNEILSELLSSLPAEISIPRCSIALGRYNYVILLKQFGFAIKSGIEQRDAAIKIGAKGATTLLFKGNKFVMPTNTLTAANYDSLKKEPNIYSLLTKRLTPEEGDAIIIGSDDASKMTAELAAKSAALLTIMSHKKHA